MIRAQIESTIGALTRTLRSARVEPADLNAVLLVGGSSRIPLVAQMITAALNRPTLVDAHPKYAVALGAATLAAEHGTASANVPPPAGAAAAPCVARPRRLDSAPAARRTARQRAPAGCRRPPRRPGARPAPVGALAPAAAFGAGWIGGSGPDSGPGTGPFAAVGTPTRPDSAPPGAEPPHEPSYQSPYEQRYPGQAPPEGPSSPFGGSAPGNGHGGWPPPQGGPAAGLDYGAPPPQSGPPQRGGPPAPAPVGGQPRKRRAAGHRGGGRGARAARRRPHLRPPAPGLGHPPSTAGPAPSARAAPAARRAARRAAARRSTASRPIPAVAGEIPVGNTPGFVAIAPNGTFAYVANRAAGVVTVVDTAIDKVVATIPIPDGPPQYLAFAPDGRGSTSASSTTRTARSTRSPSSTPRPTPCSPRSRSAPGRTRWPSNRTGRRSTSPTTTRAPCR